MKSPAQLLLINIFFIFFSCQYDNPTFQSNLSQTTVAGSIKGKYKTDSHGAATYSISVDVPPGTAGMTPDLSLVYNSNSQNGIMGVGWNIKGMSMITRGTATKAIDGYKGTLSFSNSDKFYLNGSRLINVDKDIPYGSEGSIYHREKENWDKIEMGGTQGNGNTFFSVTTKKGTIMEYGKSSNSIILAEGKNYARAWALNQITDRNGNSIKFTYQIDATTGSFYPDSVIYTINDSLNMKGRRIISFEYETRSDVPPSYLAGSIINYTQRLSQINIAIKSNEKSKLVSQYNFDYDYSSSTGRSLLTEVSKSDGAGNSFPSTVISYTQGDLELNSQTNPSTFYSGFDSLTYKWKDFNNDGLVDLLVDQHVAPYQHWVMYSDGTKLSSPISLGYFGYDYSKFSWLDYDGDGQLDLICDVNDTTHMQYAHWVALISKNKFQTPVQVGNNFGLTKADFNWVDFNGDGMLDLVVDQLDPSTSQYEHYVLMRTSETLSSGKSLGSPKSIANYNPAADSLSYEWIDFNGDGLADLAIDQKNDQTSQYQHWVLLSDGEKLQSTPISLGNRGASQAKYTWADFNGDGMDDLMVDQNTPSQNSHFVVTSSGTGVAQQIPLSSYSQPGSTISWLDFNSDGMADLIIDQNNQNQFGHWVLISTGTSLGSPISLPQFGSKSSVFSWGDFNGDGLIDLLNDQTAESYHHSAYLHSPAYPDLMGTVTNGIGGITTIKFSNLTNNSIYIKDSTAVFPDKDTQNATYVVIDQVTNNGTYNPESYHFTYQYSGAVTNYWGRGWLGFRGVSINDHQTNTITNNYYRVDFPFQGMVDSTIVLSPGNQYLTKSSYVYDTLNQYKGVYQPLRMTENLTFYNLNTPNSYTVGKKYQYDRYGNIIKFLDRGDTLIATDDLITHNKYINDTLGWRLGFQTSSIRIGNTKDTLSLVPFGAYTDTLTYDSIRYYLSHEKMNISHLLKWDNTRGNWVVRSFEYDGFGNNTAVKDPISGKSETKYDSTFHTFKVQQTNAIGETIQNTFDPATGNQLMHINESGDTIINEYDGFGRVISIHGPDEQGNVVPIKYISYKFSAPIDQGGNYMIKYQFRDDWTQSDSSKWGWKKEIKDGLERAYKVEKGRSDEDETVVKLVQFDNEARISAESMPFYLGDDTVWTKYEYDYFGRLSETQLPNGLVKKVARFISSNDGIVMNRNKTIEAWGTSDSTIYTNYLDSRGNIVRTVFPYSAENKNFPMAYFEFDALNRRTLISSENNEQTTIVYNTLGAKSRISNTTSGITKFDFYDNGAIKGQIDQKGNITSFKYDTIGRTILKVVKNSNTSDSIIYSYDSIQGLPKSRTDQGKLLRVNHYKNSKLYVQSNYHYNYNSQTDSLTIKIGGENFTIYQQFDPLGRITSYSYPDSSEARVLYDGLGRLNCSTLLSFSKDTLASTRYKKYTANSKPEIVKYLNGVETIYDYDVMGQVDTVLIQNTKDTLFYQTFERNIKEQIININDLNNNVYNESYTYFNNGYLKTAQGNYGTLTFKFDLAGNITQKDGIDYTYQGQQLMKGSNGLAVNYDQNGNIESMIGASDKISYAFDNRDLLSNVIHNSDTILKFGYDYEGKRIEKIAPDSVITLYASSHYEINKFASGGVETIKYLTANGNIVAAISEKKNDISNNVGTYYYHQNEVSNVKLLTDDRGNSISTLQYLPFGELYNPDTTTIDLAHRKFAGKELDLSGLYYFGSRYYDPILGRFISPDQNIFGGKGKSSAVFNRYCYSFNDPINLVDLTGNSVLSIFEGLLELVVAVAISAVIDPVIGISYYSGAIVNHNANPGLWKWNSPRTWLGLTLGPPIIIGAAVATDGIADAAIATGIEGAETIGNIVGGALTGALSNGSMSLIGGGSPEQIAESTIAGGVIGGLFGGLASAGFSGDPAAEPMEFSECNCSSPNETLGPKTDAGGGCFITGTSILTKNGPRRIEEIQVGDSVWARHEQYDSMSLQVVTKTFQRVTNQILELTLCDGTLIETTEEHVFWVKSKGWIKASEIEVSDSVETFDDRFLVISKINVNEQSYRSVYNFLVDNYRSYYVGSNRVLVHNNGCTSRFLTRGYRWWGGRYMTLYRFTDNPEELSAIMNDRQIPESNAMRQGIAPNEDNTGFMARVLHANSSSDPPSQFVSTSSNHFANSQLYYSLGMDERPNAVMMRFKVRRIWLWRQWSPQHFSEAEMLARPGTRLSDPEVVSPDVTARSNDNDYKD